MAGYDNMFGGRPSNNSLWVGNNYSAAPGYNSMQMPRNNYPSMSQTPTNMMQSNLIQDVPMQSNQMQNMQMQMQLPQSINNILRVMGPESAQAFQIGPNSEVILMEDSARPIFYWKESDSSGYSKTRAYKFEEVPLNSLMGQQLAQSQEDNSHNPEYVTKSDFDDFKKMIEELVMKNE